MKVQNIISAIAFTSVLFIGCSKESAVEPRNANNDTEIYEFSSPVIIGEEDEIIRINSIVKRSDDGSAVEGAQVRLYNNSVDIVATTDGNGEASIDAPLEGEYIYTISDNGTIVLMDNVSLVTGTLVRTDLIK